MTFTEIAKKTRIFKFKKPQRYLCSNFGNPVSDTLTEVSIIEISPIKLHIKYRNNDDSYYQWIECKTLDKYYKIVNKLK